MREIGLPEVIAIALAFLAFAGLIGFIAWLIFRPKLNPFPRTRP